MAEWNLVLILGNSHFDGVGLSPSPVILLTTYTKYCFMYFEQLHMVSSTIIHAIDLKHTGKMAVWSKVLV